MHEPQIIGRGLAMALFFLAPATALWGAEDANVRGGYWERVPAAPGRSNPITKIATDEDGVLWLHGGTGFYSYHADSTSFRKVMQPSGSGYQTQVHAGGKRGLFLTSSSDVDQVGKLYRLRHGQAHYVSDYHYFSGAYYPGLYVSRDGRVFNWGEDFVAVRIAGQWRRHDAVVADRRALDDAVIFDTGQNVYFYYQSKIVALDAEGNLSIQETNLELQPPVHGVLWGHDRAMLVGQYGALRCVQLSTGESLDLPETISRLPENTRWSVFSDANESTFLYGGNPSENRRHLFRLVDDGTATLLDPLAAIVDPKHHAQHPRSILTASDGSLWIARSTQGIARWVDNQLVTFGAEQGVNLDGCRYLLEDRRGTIYAAAYHGLYRFRFAPPHVVNKVRHDREPRRITDYAWKFEDATPATEPWNTRWIRAAWHVGGAVAYLSSQTGMLHVVDAATGKPRFHRPASEDPFAGGPPVPLRQGKEMLLVEAGHMKFLDRHTGEEKHSIRYPTDMRFAPVAVDKDWLVGVGYRAGKIARIDAEGKEIWTCNLSGYLQSQPVLCGATLLVQTRGSSYGNQATCGIDAASGDILWRDFVDAYGGQIDVATNGEFMVEADGWLSPARTEGWLIFRNPRTGGRLGELQREGGASAPWVDPCTGRVYAVLGSSEVVCFDGHRQRLVWETHLPEAAVMRKARDVGDQVWEATDWVDNRFLVLDQNSVVHVIDAQHGKVLARIAAAAAFDTQGDFGVKPELLMMPWLRDNQLIVATTHGVVAYRLDNLQWKGEPETDSP